MEKGNTFYPHKFDYKERYRGNASQALYSYNIMIHPIMTT